MRLGRGTVCARRVLALAVLVAASATFVSTTSALAATTGSLTARLNEAQAGDGVALMVMNGTEWDSVTYEPLDSNGDFSAAGLDPGTYLVVFAPEDEFDPPTWPWFPRGWGYAQIRATVLAGESTHLEFDKGTTGSITGRITGPGGEPAPGVQICIRESGVYFGPAWTGSPASTGTDPPCGGGRTSVAVTDTLGNYEIEGLRPQEWILHAGDPSGTLSVGYRLPGAVNVEPNAATSGVDAQLAYGFSDVPSTSPFIEAISWMAVEGISTGYTDGSFAPSAAVSRQAMASFLYQYEEQPAVTLSEPFFADVTPEHPFYAAIQWMADSGLSTGSPNPTGGKPLFRPADKVSRQAMAAFLWRKAGQPSTSAVAVFADVPPSSAFFAAIQWMATAGLSYGTPNPPGKPLYKPADAVSRQAMAAFLYRYDQG